MHSAHDDGSECGVVGTPVVGTRVVFVTLHIERFVFLPSQLLKPKHEHIFKVVSKEGSMCSWSGNSV